MSEKIIIDCDNTLGILLNEVDDGLTILYLLGTPKLELLGVTTTFGNGRIDQVYTQTQKLVKHLECGLPVLKGEGKASQGQATDASRFLVEQVNRRPGEITLLAIGPLGNLYAASLEDSDFFSKVKQIVVMGGYLQPVWLGYRYLKELNFSAHPEASKGVLSAACPVTVFPAQSCLEAPYHLRDIHRAEYWPGWMKRSLTQWLFSFGLYTGQLVFYLWDLLPAVFLNNPDLFEVQPFRVGSKLADLHQGMLVKAQKGQPAPEISLAAGIADRKAFYAELERGWRQAAETYPL
jgi:purine nucleosidase